MISAELKKQIAAWAAAGRRLNDVLSAVVQRDEAAIEKMVLRSNKAFAVGRADEGERIDKRCNAAEDDVANLRTLRDAVHDGVEALESELHALPTH